MFGQERKSPENGKKIGHCASLQLERRKREALANAPIPGFLHWTGGGRKRREESGVVRMHMKTGGLDQNTSQGGKNWQEERSAQIAWGWGVCF